MTVLEVLAVLRVLAVLTGFSYSCPEPYLIGQETNNIDTGTPSRTLVKPVKQLKHRSKPLVKLLKLLKLLKPLKPLKPVSQTRSPK